MQPSSSDVRVWISTIKGYSRPEMPFGMANQYYCEVQYVIEHKKGKIIVAPGNTIEIDNDGFTLYSTNTGDDNTGKSEGLQGFLDGFLQSVSKFSENKEKYYWRDIKSIYFDKNHKW